MTCNQVLRDRRKELQMFAFSTASIDPTETNPQRDLAGDADDFATWEMDDIGLPLRQRPVLRLIDGLGPRLSESAMTPNGYLMQLSYLVDTDPAFKKMDVPRSEGGKVIEAGIAFARRQSGASAPSAGHIAREHGLGVESEAAIGAIGNLLKRSGLAGRLPSGLNDKGLMGVLTGALNDSWRHLYRTPPKPTFVSPVAVAAANPASRPAPTGRLELVPARAAAPSAAPALAANDETRRLQAGLKPSSDVFAERIARRRSGRGMAPASPTQTRRPSMSYGR
jgi:hypothetical protein